MTGPRWDPCSGTLMSPADNALVEVVALAIRQSGLPHGSACPTFLDRDAACDCWWERSSRSMARGVIKAIVRHETDRAEAVA